MTRWANILHRKSLTFASVALLVGLIALGFTLNFPWMVDQHGTDFLWKAELLCIVSLALCVAVLINLVIDVKRGYSQAVARWLASLF